MTVAKPGEAEVMVAAGEDLLLAYPVIDPSRAERIASVARRCDLKVALDSDVAINCLAVAACKGEAIIGVLIDVDVGLHRTGVQSATEALRLAELVERTPGLELRGLFCYPGHVWNRRDDQASSLQKVTEALEETLHEFSKRGLRADTVSGGSTPTAYQSHLIPQLTEIRPGTYVFNDMNTVRGGFAELEDCAATVIATVVSDAVPDQVVIDAGSKTLGADRCIPQLDSGHGCVIEYPAAKITALSEEHGQVDVSCCEVRPRIGDQLTIVPNHICPCINLHDMAWLRQADGPLQPLQIDARGKVS